MRAVTTIWNGSLEERERACGDVLRVRLIMTSGLGELLRDMSRWPLNKWKPVCGLVNETVEDELTGELVSHLLDPSWILQYQVTSTTTQVRVEFEQYLMGNSKILSWVIPRYLADAQS